MSDVATKQDTALLLERVVVGGDLSKLTPTERMTYYNALCESVGLNPLTRPMEYLFLNNKMVLYARRDATDQLRALHGVSVTKLERELTDGIYAVVAYGEDAKGRKDSALGAVPMPQGMNDGDRANAMMKAETKAKRRLTLSLCGLGVMDETEVDIPATAVRATETVVENVLGAPTLLEQADVLFPTPESDRKSLIQRARIAMARLNKQKVGKLKEVWLGDSEADLEKTDLAALVSFVRDLEAEKL